VTTRRAFIGILAVFLLIAPVHAQEHKAQQAGKVFRVVVLGPGINPRSAVFNVAFEQRLRELGYVDGRDLVLTYRGPQPGESIDKAAQAIVREGADVIVAAGPDVAIKAAMQATDRIPIVMVAINFDPVKQGYIASLARPGRNITGISFQQLEVSAKQLELLSEAVPGRTRMGVLWEPLGTDQFRAVEAAAQKIQIELLPVEVPPPYDYEHAFRILKQHRVRGVLVLGSAVFYRDRARIQALAFQHRLPMGGPTSYVDAGVVLGYGPDLRALYRTAANYVDRILKGAKPGDLPVEQPTTFELVINLKTAKALGLTIPPSLLQRADEIIQ